MNRDVELVLQRDKLGIEVCGHGVHLFAGLPLGAQEAEDEAAPQFKGVPHISAADTLPALF